MKITDLQNTYVTSDHHFNDTRFDALYRSSEVSTKSNHIDFLVKKWNSVVSPNDTVIHLGDVAVDMDGYKYVTLLNGNIHLVRGNHDQRYSTEFLNAYFETVRDDMIVEVDDLTLYLNHFPLNARPDLFNLVGHVHSVWKVQRNMLNVGVDCWNYKPINFE